MDVEWSGVGFEWRIWRWRWLLVEEKVEGRKKEQSGSNIVWRWRRVPGAWMAHGRCYSSFNDIEKVKKTVICRKDDVTKLVDFEVLESAKCDKGWPVSQFVSLSVKPVSYLAHIGR